MPLLPLGDATRKPARFPLITGTLIAISVAALIWELGSGDAAVLRLAVVPAALMRGEGSITPLTAMFLHAGFVHIIGNMLFLSAFAPAVEDAMGRARFLAFYLRGAVPPPRRRSPLPRRQRFCSSGPVERLPQCWVRSW